MAGIQMEAKELLRSLEVNGPKLARFKQLVQVQGEDALYPDWSCHPGYNPQYGRLDDTHTDGIESIMRSCERTECKEGCIMGNIGIIEGYRKFRSEDEISRSLQKYLDLNEHDTYKTIASKIVSDCGEIAKKSGFLYCDYEFIQCVEKAWAC
ncbi:unnamed protein product [Orchesella dallaii]|uniref:Uncharacterized protein n=1 Tax=Orchesella dallaii TaxID=48710 RepID=A0ABP1RWW3_9HEXA